jgi:hypothetical protein
MERSKMECAGVAAGEKILVGDCALADEAIRIAAAHRQLRVERAGMNMALFKPVVGDLAKKDNVV